jgi:ribulose-5-phosphate 4-epimerase/fuculose-1-phosphate aldolase
MLHTSASLECVNDLVLANHILYNEGIVDGFGHVSVRHDKRADRFLISRSIAPATVTAEDIMECDYEGEPQDARARKTYLERYIHSEIYKARPDVMAVVHSHSPCIIPFGVTPGKLRPICHMSGFLGVGVPNFEIRDFAGENSDMLIRSQALGTDLARTLGSAHFVLMRGHGSTAVGPSLKLAVARAIWAESNAKLQAQSMPMGEVSYMTQGEAAATMATNEALVDRPWALWKLCAVQAMASGAHEAR